MHNYTRPNYRTYGALWDFYLESYLGGEDYINAQNLRKHKFEDVSDYEYRMKFAFYDNQCKYIVNKYSTHIYSTPPERKGLDNVLIEYFLSNINSTDNPNLFFKYVLNMILVLGEIYIAIDYPPVDPDLVNDAIVLEDGYSHTAEIILPQFVPVYNPKENLAVIEIKKGEYKVWTDEQYVYFKNNKIVTEKSAPHNFGTIPVVYAMIDTNQDNIGESLLRDISRANKAKFNLDNSRMEDIFNAPWSTMVIALDEVTQQFYEVMEQVNPNTNKLEIPRTPVMFTAPGYDPKIIESNPQFITANREESQYLTELIQRMANQKISEMALNQSGISKAYDLDNQNTALQFIAESMEALEYQFYDLYWQIAYQQPLSDDISITYNKKYDLYDSGKRLDKMQSIAESDQYPPTARNIAKLELCKDILPLSTDDEAEIQNELNEMTNTQQQTETDPNQNVQQQHVLMIDPYRYDYRKQDNRSFKKPYRPPKKKKPVDPRSDYNDGKLR